MDADITSLISRAQWWETFGYVASAFVVFGIVFESIEVIRRFKTGIRHENIFESIGFIVVVVGLSVEVIAAFETNSANELVTSSQRHEIITLEKRLADRLLVGADSKSVAEVLNKYVGQEFEIVTYPSDDESADLAVQIDRALTAAGWSEQINNDSPVFLLDVVAGVVIYVRGDAVTSIKDAALALRDQLKIHDIRAEVKPSKNLPPSIIDVTVGIRP